MGNTFPTEFGDHMGADLLGEALTAWGERAIPGGFMATDDVGVALAEVLATVLTHPGIDLCDVQFDARRPN
jgi:hypothetical protein